MVELDDLRAGYGALPVLHGFSLSVGPGEVAVLLGLNGAGKSTAVKVLCGAVAATGGAVRYRGEDITGWSTARCVRAGHRDGARGPPGVRRPHRRAQPPGGLVDAAPQQHVGRPAARARLPGAAPPRRAARPAGRHAVRRRAADAGHRPGPDGQPDGADHRRGVARPGPGDRQGDPARSPGAWPTRAPP